MKSKEIFKSISDQLKDQLPFCQHYEWWNEVVVDNLDVAVAKNESGTVVAIWPYSLRKKGPWKMLCQPAFTPYGGPIFIYPDGQKRERQYSFELKASELIAKELGEYAELLINCHLNLKNTLGFIWEGFEDRKKYTYLLDLEQSEEELFSGFRENIRRQIRKGEKSLQVAQTDDYATMGKLLQESFAEQEEDYPIEDAKLYDRIGAYLKKYNAGEFLAAQDEKGDTHAMLVCVYDKSSAYYLIGGSALAHKNSGAMSLLMHQAILNSKKKGVKAFNFEGSMIPSIEKYLRGFGGELTPYSCLIKNKSSSLKLLRKLK